MRIMKILIISGGAVQKEYIKNRLREEKFDKIIAADAGLSCLDELKICPTEILGDFDSLKNHDLLKKYQEKEISIIKFPARKDYTDTHLAIAHAVDLLKEAAKAEVQNAKAAGIEAVEESDLQNAGSRLGKDKVVILGALGTRADHSLANIGLLTRFADLGVYAAIEDEHNHIQMIKGPGTLTLNRSKKRPFTSILSFSEQTTGITLEGFSYPLDNATLKKDVSLGISNELVEPQGKIRIKSGYLLVVQARD